MKFYKKSSIIPIHIIITGEIGLIIRNINIIKIVKSITNLLTLGIFVLFLILFDIQNKLVFINIYNSLKAANVINPIYKSVRTSSLVENKSNFNITLCLLVNKFNNFKSLNVITSYLFFTSP